MMIQHWVMIYSDSSCLIESDRALLYFKIGPRKTFLCQPNYILKTFFFSYFIYIYFSILTKFCLQFSFMSQIFLKLLVKLLFVLP